MRSTAIMDEIKCTGVLITALRIFIKGFQPGHRFDTSIVSRGRIDYASKTEICEEIAITPHARLAFTAPFLQVRSLVRSSKADGGPTRVRAGRSVLFRTTMADSSDIVST